MPNIDIKFKNAWIRQLREEWKNVNYTNFRDKMRLPDIDLLNSHNTLGKWEGKPKRRLSISVFLINNHPWQYVQEILYHEMAHQYVEEALKITDDLPHGEVFKRVCYENGFDHRASEDIRNLMHNKNNKNNGTKENKILSKVHKLFSLAQSANQHEAASAMAKAQELLLKHNISLLEVGNKPNYIHKQIGEVGKRNPIKSLIGSIISEFFFVEALWVFGYNPLINKGGRILEIYGATENVEMAEYAHDFLYNISEVLWKEYKDQKKLKRNKHRRSYIYGMLNGFYKKLETKNIENENKSLVWKGDPELKKHYRRRNPRIQQSAFSYSKSCNDAYNSGISRGKNLVIHKGVKEGAYGKVHLLG